MTYLELEQIAIISIRNYLNKDFTDDEIKAKYPLAIKRLITNAQNLENKQIGVVSASEGSQSFTYAEGVEFGTITDDIKALLGRPFLRLF
jgi:hypothetical protein